MKTISTKYIPHTNYRPARMTATDGLFRHTVNWDFDKGRDDNHKAAIEAFCQKLNWHGVLALGHTKTGMVAVFLRATERKPTGFLPVFKNMQDAILLIV